MPTDGNERQRPERYTMYNYMSILYTNTDDSEFGNETHIHVSFVHPSNTITYLISHKFIVFGFSDHVFVAS